MKQLKKIRSKDQDFANWYTDIVLNASLISYGDVKGTMIIKPYGYAIWEKIKKLLDEKFKEKNILNVCLPTLIPKSAFMKEKEHLAGFDPECLIITKIGNKKLEEELILRPTSEVLFGNFFTKEIQSYNNLPLLYNQWSNVFRWEKNTRPFLRTSEFLWQEGHTVHATEDEAKAFSLEMIYLYNDFINNDLFIPTILGKKTKKETFVGAKTTYTLETIMYDGQALQTATSHYFGNNFTKTFNVKFLNKLNKMEYGYSTSWGLSTRIIGSIIMVHSDECGLILPSKIAPKQIVIIPITNNDAINEVCNNLKKKLSKKYSIFIDKTNNRFGFKAAEAEIKGIPLRIEVGNKELEKGYLIVVRRDNLKKELVKIENIGEYIKNALIAFDKSIYKKALENNKKRLKKINNFDIYAKFIKKENIIALVPFCGELKCEEKIKEETKTNSRCILLKDNNKNKKCFKCNKTTKYSVYFGKAY